MKSSPGVPSVEHHVPNLAIRVSNGLRDNLAASRIIHFSTSEIAMTNDIAVYDAIRLSPNSGQRLWTGRMGTRAAIKRDGLIVDSASLAYCPHQWIDADGYVDQKLAKKHPYHLAI